VRERLQERQDTILIQIRGFKGSRISAKRGGSVLKGNGRERALGGGPTVRRVIVF
jgi:hypothetical protein